jgi:hypothetical protein
MVERTGPLIKINEYFIKTSWNEHWKVILLGDKSTNGKLYCQAIIKAVEQ